MQRHKQDFQLFSQLYAVQCADRLAMLVTAQRYCPAMAKFMGKYREVTLRTVSDIVSF